jgi:hypothetical protein
VARGEYDPHPNPSHLWDSRELLPITLGVHVLLIIGKKNQLLLEMQGKTKIVEITIK